MCELRADLYDLISDMTFFRKSVLGPAHWKLYFDIEIKFGSTEFEAAVVWKVDVSASHRYSMFVLPIFFVYRALRGGENIPHIILGQPI